MAEPAGGTVTVACKLPNGIIMRVFKTDEYDMPVLGGGVRKETRSIAIGDPVKINGPAIVFGSMPAYAVVGGYALTTNVPAEVAKAWMEQNKGSDLVRNRLIFISDKAEVATAKAKEHKDVKSGLEPLDVGTTRREGREAPRDPRWPARSHPNLSTVGTDRNRDDAAA